jgi:hypothetical protein
VDAAEQVSKDRPCVMRHHPCCDEGTQGCNAWSSGWLTRVTSIFARRGTNSRKALWAMVLRGPQVSCPQSGSSMTTGRVYAHGGSMLALAHAGVCATCAINHGAETSGMRARQPENYPVEVPAFTHAVAAGMIGRKLVGSPVVPVVLGPGTTPPRPLRLNRPARHAHTPHAACPVTQ